MSTVATSLIEIDRTGVARIAGATTKVIEVAIDKLANDSSPEEMHIQYPHLSLAQIHAALSYYYEHQEEFDSEIARQLQEVKQLRAEQGDTPLHKRLRSMGLLK